ncbi:enoyl-CoA hydratase/isomerase family protein [Capillimicrobium parvum]|uniref:Enoyl-CoA-hydratase n=1 Tax=Capillimicrobium parvum TaxID=2884022 RepID=A0A9E7BZY3_9ACTN|nr:enoyl-CoA hydratase/isomerase family protein [Capillimicrobium parvum]UGS34813.1 Enoyl-CoA-hydratase [Capillimicrobium parvum]
MGLAELPDWHDIDLSGPLDGVLYDKADAIALITLNRPDRGNSFHAAMGPVLRAIWEDVRADQDVRAVVVTGTGDRHFCTGVDVGVVSGSGGAVAHNRPFEEEVFWSARHNRVWKPVVAAVNGTVAGGGLHFVVDADIIVASENARFIDTHTNIGMVGAIENIGLAKRLPLGTALRMSLQGPDFKLGAERAYQLGLVDELVPKGQALEAAMGIARSIAANSPSATTLTQQAIWGSLDMSYEAALRHGWSLIRLQWSHPDFLEGPRAFADGRAPEWNPDLDAHI